MSASGSEIAVETDVHSPPELHGRELCARAHRNALTTTAFGYRRRACWLLGKMRRKTETQRKKEAKERAQRALRQTKERFGLGEPGPLRGVTPSPLAVTGKPRDAQPPPTSNCIPGSAPAADLLHAHKWKRGVQETEATTCEMRRKATQIGPAYNKGALQYLPRGVEPDQWPSREDAGRATSFPTKRPRGAKSG